MVVALTPVPQCARRGVSAVCNDCLARPFSVCASVPDDDLAELSALTETRALKTSEALFRQDDVADQVFNVTSGSIRLYRLSADGRRQILGFMFAGGFLGLSRDSHWLYTAEAMEPTTVCRFRRSAFETLLAERRELESVLLSRARDELALAQAQMLRLGRGSALERLAGFLIELSTVDPLRPARPGQLRLPMTRGEIADYLGLTLETVSRGLSRLKRQGILRQVSRTELWVERPDALRDLAGT